MQVNYAQVYAYKYKYWTTASGLRAIKERRNKRAQSKLGGVASREKPWRFLSLRVLCPPNFRAVYSAHPLIADWNDWLLAVIVENLNRARTLGSVEKEGDVKDGDDEFLSSHLRFLATGLQSMWLVFRSMS